VSDDENGDNEVQKDVENNGLDDSVIFIGHTTGSQRSSSDPVVSLNYPGVLDDLEWCGPDEQRQRDEQTRRDEELARQLAREEEQAVAAAAAASAAENARRYSSTEDGIEYDSEGYMLNLDGDSEDEGQPLSALDGYAAFRSMVTARFAEDDRRHQQLTRGGYRQAQNTRGRGRGRGRGVVYQRRGNHTTWRPPFVGGYEMDMDYPYAAMHPVAPVSGSNPLLQRLAMHDGDFGPEDYDMLLRLDEVQQTAKSQHVDEGIVALLPETTVARVSDLDEDNRACSICLCDFVDGDRTKLLPCLHRFHPNCVNEWLTKHSTLCPVCKLDVSRNV
jgi:hypothetical protein